MTRLAPALIATGACLMLAGCLGDRPAPLADRAPPASASQGGYPQDGASGRPGNRGAGPYGGPGGAAGIGAGGGRGGNGGRGGDSD